MSRKIIWRDRVFFPSRIILVVTSLIVLVYGLTTDATTVTNHVSAINWHATSHALTVNTVQQNDKTIPSWTSSFTYQKQAYQYTMVGTNPAQGSATTIIPTLLVPVKIILSNGATYDGQNKVNDVLNSPLFRSASFKSGNTQYGDAIQRAEFWKFVATKSPSYHVLLGLPTVLPTLTLHVPANMGAPIERPSGVIFGGVDFTYLDTQLVNYMQAQNISTQTFPIFLSSNVFVTKTNGTTCCIGGYHNAIYTGGNAMQTYAYGTYNDPGFSTTNPKVFTTTDALSHEIAEWYNNPFMNNLVPDWSVASASEYGCNSYLDVSDPLIGVDFEIGKYRLQDAAFFSWFSHQVPPISNNKRYSYLGTFTTFSKTC